ncbi:MAG: hypothetical protein GY778_06320 [bacterium]|nr:hypothetical protein [bacterium]
MVAAALLGVSRTPGARSETPCGSPGGPDVIVGVLPNVSNWGSVGDISAFSIGTTSCNVGDADLLWQAETDQHPVIAQNLYRLNDGRFEQIGMSWLKHGFFALTQDACGCGCLGPGGDVLAVGCSDPYSSGLNGDQDGISGTTGGLGPRFEVNAHTGVFAFPYTYLGQAGDTIYKRLQVHRSDLDPAQDGGGLYYIEGQYVTPDDAAAGNQNNNASHRRATVAANGNEWRLTLTGLTERERPAIRAWKDNDPSVIEADVQVPNDGMFIVAATATPTDSGLMRYEYAVHNLNSDRSAGSFRVPIDPVATVSNIGFHDVDYHSGDGIGGVDFDGTDWAGSVSHGSVNWATQTHTQNPSASALRWGTLYNFRFDADVLPQAALGTTTVGMFKPGTPAEVTAPMPVPSDELIALSIWLPDGTPQVVPPGVPVGFDVRVIPGAETVVPASPTLNVLTNGGTFQALPLVPMGGDLYRATLPPITCELPPEFYLSATGSGGAEVLHPADAPATLLSAVVGITVAPLDDDFETDQGWTVENVDLQDGAWERGVPIAGGAPSTDYDGSGQCYVTGNSAPDSDVDGGPTRLISPTLDLSTAVDPMLTYARWISSGVFGADFLWVEVSDDNGASWVTIDGVTQISDWTTRTFRIDFYVALTDQFQLRFRTQDNPENSTTEAAVDAVTITDFRCSGALDLTAFADFAACLQGPESGIATGCEWFDFDGSGSVDLKDFVVVQIVHP